MNKEQFIKKYETEIKKGEFVKAQWQSEKIINGETYTKRTNGVIRFVKYANIKGVEVKGKVNPNENVLIPNVLYENTNTKNVLVQMATTNIKPMVNYYINGKETTKENFETIIKPRPNNGETIVFRVKIENLLSLGE